MSYTAIHDQVRIWSLAETPNTLVRALGNDPRTPPNSNKATKKVLKTIADFFKKNENQFVWNDRPALEQLQTTVQTFNNFTGSFPGNLSGIKSKKNILHLGKAISKAIEKTKINRPQVDYLPSTINSIIEEYLSLKECIDLTIIGNPPSSESIVKAINYAATLEPDDIYHFADEFIIQHKTNPPIFKLMVETFFRGASIEAQDLLFEYLYSKDAGVDDLILSKDILESIPIDAAHLNFYYYQLSNIQFLNNKYEFVTVCSREDLINLIKRKITDSTHLQTIKISEELFLEHVCSNPNLLTLNKLSIFNFSNSAFKMFDHCSSLSNLKSLELILYEEGSVDRKLNMELTSELISILNNCGSSHK